MEGRMKERQESQWTLGAAAGQQRRRLGRTAEGRAAIDAADPGQRGHSPTGHSHHLRYHPWTREGAQAPDALVFEFFIFR